ncbi:hypothetical protein J4408_03930 [Candidatus Pacearchaeota archaeon]|nr:hypothetical protein [Candidatus Pacearchaeota archaeon]
MTKVEIDISKDLEFIRQVPSVNWSILINKILKEKLREIQDIKKIVARSKLSEADAEEIAEKVNTEASKKYS